MRTLGLGLAAWRCGLRGRVAAALCGVWLLAACGESDRFSTEVIEGEDVLIHRIDEPQTVLRGVVDLTLGVLSGDASQEFSEISGLALDAEGRVIVVDRFSHDVRVFDPVGGFLYRFGGQGGGPGELDQPCCLSLGPDGLLWVRDPGNGRYNAYALDESEAEYVRQVRSASRGPMARVPLVFTRDGKLIDVGKTLDASAGNVRIIRHHLARDGSRVRDEEVPGAPPERAPTIHEQSLLSGAGRTAGAITVPAYVPRHEVAHSWTGEWAEMVTSDFLVRWYGANGSLRQVIVAEVGPGPRLTASQLEFQARQIERRGAIPGFSPVERRPPLHRLMFDREGRLWVQRTTSEGPARADVIGPDGSYEAAVEWPRSVELEFITDGWALGVERQPSGLMRVVRLRFEATDRADGGG